MKRCDRLLKRRFPINTHDAMQKKIQGWVIGNVVIIIRQAEPSIRANDEYPCQLQRILAGRRPLGFPAFFAPQAQIG